MARPALPAIPTTVQSRRRTRTYDQRLDELSTFLRDLETFLASDFVLPIHTGDIKPTLARTPPAGWLMCDGARISAAAYPDLVAVLGSEFLPDLRGRVPFGADGIRTLLQEGGQETVTLTVGQLPAHQHGVTVPAHSHTVTMDPHAHTVPGSGGSPGGGTSANGSGTISTSSVVVTGTVSTAPAAPAVVTNTGNGEPVPILPPYVVVNWMVKT
jgi:microcystin-dependent protein